MFETTASFTLFDYFRIPHMRAEVVLDALPDVERVAVAGSSSSLLWPAAALLASMSVRPGLHLVRAVPFVARALADVEMQALVQRLPGSWTQADVVRDRNGAVVSGIWRSDDGSSLLPFDPNEVVSNYWTERYVVLGPAARRARLSSLARHAYYRARPFLPRSAQMRLRRSFSRLQQKAPFPRWPVETAVDDFFTLLLELVAGLSDKPVPFIRFWPSGHSWAIVLTHDVEQKVGYKNLHKLMEIELEEGYRSSWNFVPYNGYVVERRVLDELRADGFEVGVHGLYHDGRDLLPRTLPRRLPAMRAYAEQWGAVGFRSPATIRSVELIPTLGFDYDSSYSDTAPFEPQAGGCCSWLPYMLEDTVELPITLVQDHTLFALLGRPNGQIWLEKARFLRDRGGMALMLIHPDYLEFPNLCDSYRSVLHEFASDESAWKALPRDVSTWWRRRGESTLTEVEGEWQVVGPAAGEARIDFIEAAHSAARSG
jgi:hypothetical protein